jgi:1,4-dihydroxy-2-naphthoyl-CoA hydrolase
MTTAPLPDWYAEMTSALDTKMGFEVLELSPERVVGRMPVAGNTQPFGLWHGGASAQPKRVAVGVDINVTHHRPVRSGRVTGTATALRLGRTVASYEVVLTDDEGRRVGTGRVTCQFVERT